MIKLIRNIIRISQGNSFKFSIEDETSQYWRWLPEDKSEIVDNENDYYTLMSQLHSKNQTYQEWKNKPTNFTE